MQISLTLKEAKHLLAYNTGYLSCPLYEDDGEHTEHRCPYYKEANRKILLAMENEAANNPEAPKEPLT